MYGAVVGCPLMSVGLASLNDIGSVTSKGGNVGQTDYFFISDLSTLMLDSVCVCVCLWCVCVCVHACAYIRSLKSRACITLEFINWV